MGRPQSFSPAEALDLAMGLFWSQGYEATSVDDLCRTLDVSKPALYRQWGSKDVLYQQALRRYRALGHADFLAALGDEPERAVELIRARLEAIVNEALLDPQSRGCLVVNAICERSAHDAETHEQVTDALGSLERHLTKALRAAKKAGVELRGDPTSLARFIVVVIQGLRVVGKVRPDRPTLRTVVDIAVGALRES
jgi:TetR/AcrR family transcriptional regulator, transcriptional repressor for nem operon